MYEYYTVGFVVWSLGIRFRNSLADWRTNSTANRPRHTPIKRKRNVQRGIMRGKVAKRLRRVATNLTEGFKKTYYIDENFKDARGFACSRTCLGLGCTRLRYKDLKVEYRKA